MDFTPIGPAVVAQCLPVLNRHGRAVLMAGNPSLFEVSYLDIMTREPVRLRVPARHPCRRAAGRASSSAAGELNIDRFVTHRFALPDVQRGHEDDHAPQRVPLPWW